MSALENHPKINAAIKSINAGLKLFSKNKVELRLFPFWELWLLRKLLLQNDYPAGVINYINDVLNRQQNRPRNPTTTLTKREDYMTEKLNILKGSLVPVMHLLSQTTSTGHNLKWDHFGIIAKGRSDTHCKIKDTLLIQELKPTLNDSVISEKLYLY